MNGPTSDPQLLGQIRNRVRERLSQSPAFRALGKEQRAQIAHDTVQAFHYILGGTDGHSRPHSVTLAGNTPVAEQLAGRAPLPEGDTAGQRFAESGAIAAEQGSEAYANLIQQVDFPEFVAGLIDGVFNAIVHSSIKQMEAYAELVKNVAKSVDRYMKDNVTQNNARDYLAERYPEALELDLEGDKPRLRLKKGAEDGAMPDFGGDLGMTEAVDSVDDDAVEEKLVPAARRRIAMDRQQLLATMVMMGVNRLVVTNGTIEASCMFELNTTDRVKRRMEQKRTSDFQAKRHVSSGYRGSSKHESSGFLGLGPSNKRKSSWYGQSSYDDAASFNVTTTRSEDSENKVQMHAKLAGKVNVQFKSDYFPMERMIDALQIGQIRAKTPAGDATNTAGAPGQNTPPGAPARTPQPAAAAPAR
jgi:hypothetical protein